jgi:hypothetical protein
MSGHELYTRSRQEIAKRSDAILDRAGVDPFRLRAQAGAPRGHWYSDPEDVPRILDVLRQRMPDQAGRIVERAERVLERKFDLLGYQGLDFGRDIDWSLDPVSGRRAPSRPWPSIRYLDFQEVGDHKVVWELNRHQFLVTLAKAYRLTGDARFARGLMELWYDWRRKNPYPIGINWTSTLEVALRAHSWLWAEFLLEGAAEDAPAFRADLEAAMARSAWYIERFLSTYFAPNTHLMGEGVALFLIGARHSGLARAAQWRRSGWQIALEEAERQVRPDGLHFEQSIYYHVYGLDLLLYAFLMARRNGVDVPQTYERTLRRMTTALAELSQAGALPRFGDDDGGRLFDGSRNSAAEMLDPLSTGATLFGDAKLRAAAPGLTEETLWLLGPQSGAAFDAVTPARSTPHPMAFRESGLYAMSVAGPPEAQLFIDAGEQGALSAGHGHADALSIQLASGGRLWLTDPGSYVYMDNAGARDRFRGSAAHNTLVVDGASQADPRGPFGWGPRPRVEVRRWDVAADLQIFEGAHYGYERLPQPVVHRRMAVGWRDAVWLVRDVVEGAGEHMFDIYFHFAPEADVRPREGGGIAASIGAETLVVIPPVGSVWERHIETGEYSPVYGARISAPVARWSSRGACPAEFTAVLSFASPGVLTLIEEGVYEYEAAGSRRQFRFNAPAACAPPRRP